MRSRPCRAATVCATVRSNRGRNTHGEDIEARSSRIARRHHPGARQLPHTPRHAPSAKPSASALPADVTGTWMGGTATGTTNMRLQLKQTGTNVTGTLAGVGAVDGPINGVTGGDTIQLSAERGAFAPRLVVRGDLMNGELDGVPLNLVRLGSTQSPR